MKNLSMLLVLVVSILLFQCKKDDTIVDPGNDETDQPSTLLNLDFEDELSDATPLRWYSGGTGYDVKIDQSNHYSGKKSLKITYLSGSGSFGVATSSFPLNEALGSKIRFTGYIKSENITSGYAGLWMRIDRKDGSIDNNNFDNMSNRGVTGSNGWNRFEINLQVDQTAQSIYFGALLTGNGTAWFDHFSFTIDGHPYSPVTLTDITDSQMNWLKSNVDTFQTYQAGSGFADLTFLQSYIGNSKIVSLGEGTHGTHEFFKMKHRILEYLVENMGFTLFGIEANMPECRAINDYVLYGKGNAKDGLRGIYFWTWDTQEVLDMIEWMRQYNQSGKGTIQFLGFDMQTPTVAMTNVEKFIGEVEPDYLATASSNYDAVRTIWNDYASGNQNPDFQSWKSNAQIVLNHLISNSTNYLTSKSQDEVDQAVQDARVVVQAASPGERDKSMAENVQWILNHSQAGSKIVLWAHNGHVMKYISSMGGYLSAVYGSDMTVFGFCFHHGKYTARGSNGLQSYYTTTDSSPGSVEWAFHSTGFKRFMLNLHKVNANDANSNWLVKPILFRNIGAVAMEYAFSLHSLTNEYDALIFFDQTTASELLRDNLYSGKKLSGNTLIK